MAGVVYLIEQIALFLVAKCFAVADEKFKIARIRLINPRKINFINDAMAEGEPEAAASGICGPKTFLCAGRPTRLNSGRSKRRATDLRARTHIAARDALNQRCVANGCFWHFSVY